MADRNRERADLGEQTNNEDRMAGSEGIEDPVVEQGRQQGREGRTDEAESFSGQGNQREGSPDPEGTGYTGTDHSESESEPEIDRSESEE